MKKKNNEKQRGPVKGVKLEQVSRSEFGKKLFAIRRARGISQKELGEKIGVSLRMISYYERDENGPPIALLKKISAALNVTSSYLLGESTLKVTIKDDVDPTLKKPIETLQALPRNDKKNAINMIEALALRANSHKNTVATAAGN
jgi:transcriptional regulator with XRE-family HTH domain